MENGHDKPAAPPEGKCWIDKGVLRVELPLFMPNGEFIAYGMLHKAQDIVATFFKHIERESAEQKGPRILAPLPNTVIQ